jgi:EAL domain-containing protein (putative c-di-GMP-specific phosphodiesterase class I)
MIAGDGEPAVIDYLDPLVLMQRVAQQSLELIDGAEGALVGLSKDGYIAYVCGAGYLSGSVGTRTPLESSIGGLSVRSVEVLRCDDTETDPRVDRAVCRRLGTRSTVCLPLSRGGRVFGMLAVGSSRPFTFDDGDVADLQDMAELISMAVGIADDCGRVHAELSRIAANARFSERVTPTKAGRFVMNVLDPKTAMLVEARQRVEYLLAEPSGLSLVFQPIVRVASGDVVALEALSRFNGLPRRTPDQWFKEAQLTGLGADLETLAVTKALACLPALPDHMAMTVNLGPQTMQSSVFLDAINATKDLSRVVIELTEHAVIDDYSDLTETLIELRKQGLRLAVDDTGAGFASLAHILKLAPDFIKLDRGLVTGIDLDPVRRSLATALVSFATETGAQIIAEGVETQDELNVVHRLGIHCAQGFHLGRPDVLEAIPLRAKKVADQGTSVAASL